MFLKKYLRTFKEIFENRISPYEPFYNLSQEQSFFCLKNSFVNLGPAQHIPGLIYNYRNRFNKATSQKNKPVKYRYITDLIRYNKYSTTNPWQGVQAQSVIAFGLHLGYCIKLCLFPITIKKITNQHSISKNYSKIKAECDQQFVTLLFCTFMTNSNQPCASTFTHLERTKENYAEGNIFADLIL